MLVKNYFNYFTEIEEYFWQKRGAHILVSTLDWAVIETWQRSGIPLEAVLKGIDRAFERWTRRRRPGRIKSLLYCVDAVAQVTEEMKEAAAGRTVAPASPTFTALEIATFFRHNASELRAASQAATMNPALAEAFADIASTLAALATQVEPATPADRELEAGALGNLEELERHLTVFEEKLLAALTQATPADELVQLRREVEHALAPYRRKMTAAQIALVEKQYMQKKLFERCHLPRLSLFYLPTSLAPRES